MNEGRRGCDRCGQRGVLRYAGPRQFHCPDCLFFTGRAFEAKVQDVERALATEQVDAERTSLQQEEALLQFALKLLAMIRVAIEKKRHSIPDTICGVVSASLFAKIFGTCRALYKLCGSGYCREAPSLTRSALEALINLRFITTSDCEERATRWAKFSYIVQWEALKANPDLESGIQKQMVQERAERVQADFPNKFFWAAGLGIGSLRHMAQQVNLEWHYNMIYWSGSQATHASPIAVDDYLTVLEERTPLYLMGLSTRHLRAELAAGIDILIRGMFFLDEAFSLGLRPLIKEWEGQYAAIAYPPDEHAQSAGGT